MKWTRYTEEDAIRLMKALHEININFRMTYTDEFEREEKKWLFEFDFSELIEDEIRDEQS